MVMAWTLPLWVRSMVPTQLAGSPSRLAVGWAFRKASLNSWVVRVTWLS